MRRIDPDELVLWGLAIAIFTLSVVMLLLLVGLLIGVAKGVITI